MLDSNLRYDLSTKIKLYFIISLYVWSIMLCMWLSSYVRLPDDRKLIPLLFPILYWFSVALFTPRFTPNESPKINHPSSSRRIMQRSGNCAVVPSYSPVVFWMFVSFRRFKACSIICVTFTCTSSAIYFICLPWIWWWLLWTVVCCVGTSWYREISLSLLLYILHHRTERAVVHVRTKHNISTNQTSRCNFSTLQNVAL